jgi:hypothetical protein
MESSFKSFSVPNNQVRDNIFTPFSKKLLELLIILIAFINTKYNDKN